MSEQLGNYTGKALEHHKEEGRVQVVAARKSLSNSSLDLLMSYREIVVFLSSSFDVLADMSLQKPDSRNEWVSFSHPFQ
jgi:hypothetical protein